MCKIIQSSGSLIINVVLNRPHVAENCPSLSFRYSHHRSVFLSRTNTLFIYLFFSFCIKYDQWLMSPYRTASNNWIVDATKTLCNLRSFFLTYLFMKFNLFHSYVICVRHSSNSNRDKLSKLTKFFEYSASLPIGLWTPDH